MFILGNFNKTSEEKQLTRASLDNLEKALKESGYKVTRTSMSISASKGGFWSNGKESNIIINDLIEYRECINQENSYGLAVKPAKGRLAKIIELAESYMV